MGRLKEIIKAHPEWFRELFRWLKDRGDYSYQYVLYGFTHYLFDSSTPERCCRKTRLIDIFDWEYTSSDLKIEVDFFMNLNGEWEEYWYGR